jgi:uncharacterized phage protein (TIGR01671 family)
MREIKFRGKRVDNGEWAFGYYWSNECGNHFIRVTKEQDGETIVLYDVEVDPETIGQYTGLKDKNGKEIYKGDLLFAVDIYEKLKGFVSWWLDRWVLTYKVEQTEQLQNQSLMIIADHTEIIGNIHDNPELLEVK